VPLPDALTNQIRQKVWSQIKHWPHPSRTGDPVALRLRDRL